MRKFTLILAVLWSSPPTAIRLLEEVVDLQQGDVVVQNGANSIVGQVSFINVPLRISPLLLPGQNGNTVAFKCHNSVSIMKAIAKMGASMQCSQ